MHSRTRPMWSTAAILAAAVLTFGCDEDPTGAVDDGVAGSYAATQLVAYVAGDTIDALAEGGYLRITLDEDGTTSGSLFVVGGDEDGGDFQADLEGTWSIDGSTVTFEHEADTFVRGMEFTFDDGQLVGDETFGDGDRIVVTLESSDPVGR